MFGFYFVAYVLSVLLIWKLYKYLTTHAECQFPYRLDEQLVVVTGCNQGIGFELVGELARRGAHVIMACRDMGRANAARQRLLDIYGTSSKMDPDRPYLSPIKDDQLVCEQLDLASYKSIRDFSHRMQAQNLPINILVNHGGIYLKRPEYDSSGIELQLKVNHLGHFLLSELLRPLLEAAPGIARIVATSSVLHRFCTLNLDDLSHPGNGDGYSSSKLANVVHSRELAKRWGPKIVTASVHPGVVKTEVLRYHPWVHWLTHNAIGWIIKTPQQGAQTLLHCCLAKDLISGGYYAECQPATVNRQVLEDGVGEKLWSASEHLIEQWSQQTGEN